MKLLIGQRVKLHEEHGTWNEERGMRNEEREKLGTKPSNLTLCPISNFISHALFCSKFFQFFIPHSSFHVPCSSF